MKTEQLQFCKEHNITEEQFYGKEVISGGLDLRSVTTVPDGFNPTVGGDLDLRGVTTVPDGFNPTVGGGLDLLGVTTVPDGFNPTVGGDLYLRSVTTVPDGFNPTVGKKVPNPRLEWQDGKYICADGILTEVVSKRANVYRVRKIARKEIEYLITDGQGNYAHGTTLKEAKEDLVYKITDRKKSDYEHLSLTDTITHEDGITCYRVITGACSIGARDFVENHLGDKRKKSYTIAEIIELTEGRYGNKDFAGFFKNR